MARERTLALVKPCSATHTREIIGWLQKEMFVIVGQKLIHMSLWQAKVFYDEHRERHFFTGLTNFMASGPMTALVLEHLDGGTIARWRTLIGATDPNNALEGTIRHRFGRGREHMYQNVVHGSDKRESAEREIALIFGTFEIFVMQ